MLVEIRVCRGGGFEVEAEALFILTAWRTDRQL